MDTIGRALVDKMLAQVQRRLGDRARRPAFVSVPPAISTGFAPLDRALEIEGLARGQITELAGQPTSGASTVALHVMARAQASGNLCAYVDLAGTFDQPYAQACGVAVADLVQIRPRIPTDALRSIETLVLAGAGVVVVDSLDELARFSRPGLSWWSLVRRLRPALPQSSCALLVLSPRYPKAEEALAAVRLVFRRREWHMQSGRMVDFQTRVLIQRSPFLARQRQLDLTIPLTGALSGL